MNIFEDASNTVVDRKGRNVYYWNEVSAHYFVNDDTVYKASYSAAVTNNLSSGTEKVYFFEIGTYLVILDPENNEGWYISSGSSTTLNSITDTEFPPNQTPALQLTRGGAVLNGILYVGATNGELWNSATEDPTSWDGLDFRTAEVNQDDGVMMFKHADHVAFAGTQTIEFFYDNANTVGSPLNPRTDINYSVGMIDADTLWSDGQTTFFCSLNPSGDINVLRLSGFELSKISTPDIDSFLTDSVINSSIQVMGSGFTAGGRSFYILTTFIVSGSVSTYQSIVYDQSVNAWYPDWELMHSGIDNFPLIGWTQSTATRAGVGILTNGDLVTILDDQNPQDTVEASGYFVDDYIEPGYIEEFDGSGAPIQIEIILGQVDFGSRGYKYATNLKPVALKTTNTQTLTVQHSDEGNDNYTTGRTIDTSDDREKLTRLGRFRTRNHKLIYAGDEKYEIEAIELDVNV